MVWQLIKTAPRDGRDILAVIKSPPPEVKRWIDEHHAPCEYRYYILIIRFWRGEWKSNIDDINGVATHWTPLPEFPITQTSEGERK